MPQLERGGLHWLTVGSRVLLSPLLLAIGMPEQLKDNKGYPPHARTQMLYRNAV